MRNISKLKNFEPINPLFSFLNLSITIIALILGFFYFYIPWKENQEKAEISQANNITITLDATSHSCNNNLTSFDNSLVRLEGWSVCATNDSDSPVYDFEMVINKIRYESAFQESEKINIAQLNPTGDPDTPSILYSKDTPLYLESMDISYQFRDQNGVTWYKSTSYSNLTPQSYKEKIKITDQLKLTKDKPKNWESNNFNID